MTQGIFFLVSILYCFALVFVVFYFILFLFIYIFFCERFEPRRHFKSRLSLIVRVNIVLNRTVVDSD